MRLTDAQLRSYQETGFLLIPTCVTDDVLEAFRSELPRVETNELAERVLESDGRTLRSLYGAHLTNEFFRRFVRHAGLVGPAQQILGGDVYIHQFKVNAKKAFAGEVWEWHQDYVIWRNKDRLPTDRALNAVVFLDEVTEFNGPLLLIPGSHRFGVLGEPAAGDSSTKPTAAWTNDVGTALDNALGQTVIAEMVQGRGIVAPKGAAGAVLFFHPNACHGSAPNMSPFDRGLAIVTYNGVDNRPRDGMSSRPAFMAGRDYTPLEMMDEHAILAGAAAPVA